MMTSMTCEESVMDAKRLRTSTFSKRLLARSRAVTSSTVVAVTGVPTSTPESLRTSSSGVIVLPCT